MRIVCIALYLFLVSVPLSAIPLDVEYETLFGRIEQQSQISEREMLERLWSDPGIHLDPYPLSLYTASEKMMAEDYLRRAASYYKKAQSVTEELRRELFRLNQKEANLPGDVWWRMIDERDRLHRVAKNVKRRYFSRLTENYGNVLRTLDQVQNRKIRNDPSYLFLLRHSLRMVAIHMVAIDGFEQAQEALEEYGKFPESDSEWPFHRYLYIVYRHQFRIAAKGHHASDMQLRKMRKRKNYHLLRATELRYGMGSEQRKRLLDAIRIDELGNPRRESDL